MFGVRIPLAPSAESGGYSNFKWGCVSFKTILFLVVVFISLYYKTFQTCRKVWRIIQWIHIYPWFYSSHFVTFALSHVSVHLIFQLLQSKFQMPVRFIPTHVSMQITTCWRARFEWDAQLSGATRIPRSRHQRFPPLPLKERQWE